MVGYNLDCGSIAMLQGHSATNREYTLVLLVERAPGWRYVVEFLDSADEERMQRCGGLNRYVWEEYQLTPLMQSSTSTQRPNVTCLKPNLNLHIVPRWSKKKPTEHLSWHKQKKNSKANMGDPESNDGITIWLIQSYHLRWHGHD